MKEKYIKYAGFTLKQSDWCKILDIDKSTLTKRFKSKEYKPIHDILWPKGNYMNSKQIETAIKEKGIVSDRVITSYQANSGIIHKNRIEYSDAAKREYAFEQSKDRNRQSAINRIKAILFLDKYLDATNEEKLLVQTVKDKLNGNFYINATELAKLKTIMDKYK